MAKQQTKKSRAWTEAQRSNLCPAHPNPVSFVYHLAVDRMEAAMASILGAGRKKGITAVGLLEENQAHLWHTEHCCFKQTYL